MGKFLKKFIKKSDGTTAIEFSLLFVPFLFLSLGILEIALMYTSASLLEEATGSAARLIRTGEIQQSGSGDPEGIFRDRLCQLASILIACDDITVEVATLNSFADFGSVAPNFDGDGNIVSAGFNPAGADGIALIRTSVRYEMLTPLVGKLLTGPSNSRLFISTIVLRTEPFDFQGAGV